MVSNFLSNPTVSRLIPAIIFLVLIVFSFLAVIAVHSPSIRANLIAHHRQA